MHTDPTTYILAASILSGAIGFIGASLMAAHQVRRANNDGYAEAVRHYQAEARRKQREAVQSILNQIHTTQTTVNANLKEQINMQKEINASLSAH